MQAIFIVAPKNFRDEELLHPLAVLQQAGITTTIAATEAGKCIGSLGSEVEAQIGINQINAEDFDAIIFVGGSGSEIYFEDATAHLLVQKAFANGKIVAAICAAPVILAKAGVLKNKNATCYSAAEYIANLQAGGANYVNEDVVVAGKIITASGPAAATAFGEKIVEKLGK